MAGTTKNIFKRIRRPSARVLWACAVLVPLLVYQLVFAPMPLPEGEVVYAEGVGRVCNGWNSDAKEMGASWVPCPKGYAIYAVDDPGGGRAGGPPQYVPVKGSCCPLPFEDILTDEHLYNVYDDCPDGYVATGGISYFRRETAADAVANWANCGDKCGMRCTKVNTEKYTLGKPVPAVYWVREWSSAMAGYGFSARAGLEDVPPAIRYSLGREDSYKNDNDGCVGYPYGSLLVSKRKKSCDGFLFRRLLYKDGSPVPMFPKCTDVKDRDSENPQPVF